MDIVKAVIQGTASRFRTTLNWLREDWRRRFARWPRGTPGRTPVFIQTVSDATGLPIRVMDESGAPR